MGKINIGISYKLELNYLLVVDTAGFNLLVVSHGGLLVQVLVVPR